MNEQETGYSDQYFKKPTHRMEKVNKHIQRIFGEILQKEADLPTESLVTISYVETTPNLRSAKVWLSVYPENQAEAVLKVLRPQMYDLQGSLNRQLKMHPLPRIFLNIDKGARHAENIERKVKELDNE